ncbi:MAG: BadF/BadG/BcrA/BcrD ATPase family protein [Gemmatimonadota bacterium]|nr:BadF/BadG/BcrA/BcrD ATPase family protein [Gemmatimonadota bacterium]
MTIVIGVDAGGTSSTAAVWQDGVEAGRATGGAGAVRPTRAMAAASNIADTVRLALTKAGALQGDILVVGAAGAGREEERNELRTALRMHHLAERLIVTTDVELALAAAFGSGPGIILIAGTGSIAVARTADGSVSRAGGFGWQMGDEGGGYWIGRMGLQALSRSSDGRGGATVLLETMGPIVRCGTFQELVRWSVTATPSEVAALAPGVVAAAARGDQMAAAILDRAADELVGLVRAVMPEGGGATVALSGGLIGAEGPLRERVAGRLTELDWLQIHSGPLDPVEGALGLVKGGTSS